MQTKDDLRQSVSTSLKKKTISELSKESEMVVSKLRQVVSDGATVMAYYPLNDEVDLKDLLESLSSRGLLVLPRMVKNRIKPFLISNLKDELILSKRWGLEQGGIKIPSKKCQEVDPQAIDVIIVPGRAFDKQGNRIGRGRGHYDRFLPLLRDDVLKIGVCFNLQLFESVPVEEHDIQLDQVITT